MAALNLATFWESSDTKCSLSSSIPTDVGSQQCILGIDEAGRGPVLGPMVYGACYCPISMKDQLKNMGFADSKTLTEGAREKHFQAIDCCSYLGWIVEILSPNYISNLMLRRTKYNLNSISHDSAAGLIEKLTSRGVNIAEVYVDTVGDPTKYQTLLGSKFPHMKITVAAKADSLYPIVSSASICAKVTRDHVIADWRFSEQGMFTKEEFGSGYPADPVTKEWLASNTDPVFGFPSIVRFSWSTAANILSSDTLAVKWEDDDGDSTGSAKITQFFSSKIASTQQSEHKYFRERCLKTVTCS